nr:GDSL-type esterase/lipase family protein [Haliscomenobacter sp.]
MIKQNTLLFTMALSFLFMAMTKDEVVKVVLFGDSITQAGIQPGGYITKMKEALAKQGIKDKYQLIGAGIGGNKVYDLYLRLEEDVLAQKPNIVVIYVGVNDVWHKTSHQTGTDPDKFEKFYVALVKKFQTNGIKVICCTPAVIGERTDHSNQQDGDLNRYSTMIRDIAAKYDCPVADLRKEFLAYNLKNNPKNQESGILTTDRVHLNDVGNQLVADLLLKMIAK